ncbi:DNA-binding protein [Campylobacter hyointestinalis]|uniref:DNA-binding protein n=1 Tax=Campylobacter hyointestinalis subsp. hyointestinalis TaxID=91352 RepID=A0A2S5J573_CAMHY|nr:DNA-binding protein [Campylobacter hyointestinalis]PPB54967.1 DNA-binding protein [Campylobacter hyointestinalis subsp. hyointestinalis]PPB55457.1 DNA-binding protein [Campylobacter hyointestinalis subsp. hyointestinalis]PPB58597.1 DNA-binding protein [Campylobacter hyointestinalis subsp. hyointestinalis]PPB60491.1 DNA-binding protein [Campylobacter hyointestinalis subsp. hyointestinalis]PPB61905.1 DNA-binding protein [Campylobacter hyointestinalis subsp. hyointestinalis]
MLSNYDLFVYFYNRVKDSDDISEIIKEYGGASIYVPSYKTTFRNDDIANEYEALVNSGKSASIAIREIATKHNLSYNSVQAIVKESQRA